MLAPLGIAMLRSHIKFYFNHLIYLCQLERKVLSYSFYFRNMVSLGIKTLKSKGNLAKSMLRIVPLSSQLSQSCII